MVTSTAIDSKSSERLIRFLDKQGLHKKDFAEMIGVTLSYVYSLIDEEVAFSTRTTTLERIAVVMGVSPDSFPEYRLSEEPQVMDAGVDFLKSRQQKLGLTNIQLVKRFPRSQRVDVVDMWRGAKPLPIDWHKLLGIASVLEIRKEDIYPYWQARLQQYLIAGGIDPLANIGLLNAIFSGIKDHLRV